MGNPLENSLGIQFGISIGTNGYKLKLGVGAQHIHRQSSVMAAYGFGVTYHSNFFNTNRKGVEFRGSFKAGFNDGTTEITLGSSKWLGLGQMSKFDQRIGMLSIKSHDFRFSYENDGFPFGGWAGDGGDSYRTAAVRIGIGNDFSAGFNLFTGYRNVDDPDESKKIGTNVPGEFNTIMPNGFVIEEGTQYRAGIAYISYKGATIGIDSDKFVRHPIQDLRAHDLKLLNILDTRQPGFVTLSDKILPFIQLNTVNFQIQQSILLTLYDDHF